MKHITKFIAVGLLVLTLLGTASTAIAANVTFRHTNGGTLTFNSASQAFWVGPGRDNRARQVSVVQAANNTINGQLRLAVDGLHGPLTNTEIRAFQLRQGLSVDGIVGPNTWGRYHTLRGSATAHRLPFML